MALINLRGIIVGEAPQLRMGKSGEFLTFRLSEGRKKQDGSYENAYYDVAVYGEKNVVAAKAFGHKDRVELDGILYFEQKTLRNGAVAEFKKISISENIGHIAPWVRDENTAPTSPAPHSAPAPAYNDGAGPAFPSEASGMCDDVPF